MENIDVLVIIEVGTAFHKLNHRKNDQHHSNADKSVELNVEAYVHISSEAGICCSSPADIMLDRR